jgi:hypothetical protein
MCLRSSISLFPKSDVFVQQDQEIKSPRSVESAPRSPCSGPKVTPPEVPELARVMGEAHLGLTEPSRIAF